VIHALEVHSASGVKAFKPTGVSGEWELEIITARGPEPGGVWSSEDVARAVVEDIYDS